MRSGSREALFEGAGGGQHGCACGREGTVCHGGRKTRDPSEVEAPRHVGRRSVEGSQGVRRPVLTREWGQEPVLPRCARAFWKGREAVTLAASGTLPQEGIYNPSVTGWTCIKPEPAFPEHGVTPGRGLQCGSRTAPLSHLKILIQPSVFIDFFPFLFLPHSNKHVLMCAS